MEIIAPGSDKIKQDIGQIISNHAKDGIVPLPIKTKKPHKDYAYYDAFTTEKLQALGKANTRMLWAKIEDRYYFTINANVDHLIRGHKLDEVRVQLWFYENSSNPRRLLVEKDLSSLPADSNLRDLEARNSICLMDKKLINVRQEFDDFLTKEVFAIQDRIIAVNSKYY